MNTITTITITTAILRFIRTKNIFANYRIFTGFLQLVKILKIRWLLPRAAKKKPPVFKTAKVKTGRKNR